MNIIELRDVRRENEHIHYRKRYSAVLVYTTDSYKTVVLFFPENLG